MRDLSAREAQVSALKADALSLPAWQVGMWIATFPILGRELHNTDPVFWFIM